MTKPAAVRKARALAQAMVLRDERAKASAKKRRSAAARKGWETRRAKALVAAREEIMRMTNRIEAEIKARDGHLMLATVDPAAGFTWGYSPDPNPWPRLAAKVRRWWQRATQWWRQ